MECKENYKKCTAHIVNILDWNGFSQMLTWNFVGPVVKPDQLYNSGQHTLFNKKSVQKNTHSQQKKMKTKIKLWNLYFIYKLHILIGYSFHKTNGHSYTSKSFNCFINVILNLKNVAKSTAVTKKCRCIGSVKGLKILEDGWLELI